MTNIHFWVISRTSLLRLRNVSDRSCRGNQNRLVMFNNFFFSKIVPFNEIMWKNIVQPGRPQLTINTVHAHFTLGTYLRLQTHTFRMCNTYTSNLSAAKGAAQRASLLR